MNNLHPVLMNKRIIVCNIVFYFITLLLYAAARQNPSGSLGYGFLLVIFWGAAAITLITLLATKVIRPRSILDKVGVVLAIPIFSLIIVTVFTMASNEIRDSEEHLNNGNTATKLSDLIFENPDVERESNIIGALIP